jgi:rhodanese-related sulfurtransferase/DNA-binding transcriptional ArsR family regulator
VTHREFKDALYAQFARIGSALSSERRLEIVDLLTQAPRHVESLSAETGMSVANVSQHLQVLRQARLVESEREGTKVIYRLGDDRVLRLWLELRGVGEERLADVRALVEAHGLNDKSLDVDTARRLAREGQAVLVDVRPAHEYEHGHLPEAVSFPIEDLPRRAHELPRDRRILAYCRGAYCLFADEAVSLLRDKGYDAARLADGWLEFRAARRATARA